MGCFYEIYRKHRYSGRRKYVGLVYAGCYVQAVRRAYRLPKLRVSVKHYLYVERVAPERIYAVIEELDPIDINGV